MTQPYYITKVERILAVEDGRIVYGKPWFGIIHDESQRIVGECATYESARNICDHFIRIKAEGN